MFFKILLRAQVCALIVFLFCPFLISAEEDPPLFEEMNGALGGGGVRFVLNPTTNELSIVGSPMSGMAGQAHLVTLSDHKILIFDGSYAVLVGAAQQPNMGWTSAGGISFDGNFGYGYTTPSVGPLKGVALGNVEVSANAIYRGVEENYIGGELGVEGGLAFVKKPFFVMVSVASDASGKNVRDEPDYIALEKGARFRLALQNRIYLKVALDKTFYHTLKNFSQQSIEIFLDVKVCKVCMLGVDFKATTSEDINTSDVNPETEYIFTIHGGLSI